VVATRSSARVRSSSSVKVVCNGAGIVRRI
jgi:ribosomal protein L36